MLKVGKKMTACLLATAMLACEAPIDVSAGNLANYYTSDDDSISVNGGGKLYTHAERQTYGSTSKNGTVWKVKFYVYAKYEGKKKVTSIKCSWKTGAKMRSSATMSLNTSAGSTYSFGASASNSWQNIESAEKYWCSTNGSKIVSENSNFTIAPDCDLKGYLFWITTTATVKVKGGAKKSSISCGC